MKHPLRVLGERSDRTAADPVMVAVGRMLLSIEDAHDGSRARRFGELLEDHGARIVEAHEPRETVRRIVIRSTPESEEARLRAEVLEESADLVLGSARPAFAKLLAETVTRG